MAAAPDIGITVRRRAPGFDRTDFAATMGGLCVSAGIWTEFGPGWALIAGGALMLLGAFVFAFAASRVAIEGTDRVDPA